MDDSTTSSTTAAVGKTQIFAFAVPAPPMEVQQQHHHLLHAAQPQQQHGSPFLPPATPRKRRRSEENPGLYYYASQRSTPAHTANLPHSASHNDAHTFRSLISPSSSSTSPYLSSSSSSSSSLDGLAPPLSKRPHSLHRTWTAPVSPFSETPPGRQQQQIQERMATTTGNGHTSASSSSSATARDPSVGSQSTTPSGTHLRLSAQPASHQISQPATSAAPVVQDDMDMSHGDAASSPSSAFRSPPPRLLSPAAVSPSGPPNHQAKPAFGSSSPSSSSSSSFPPAVSPSSNQGLSTPWQRRFADSSVALATSASFPFTRRATLGNHTGAQLAASVALGSTGPIFGVPAFATRTSSLSPNSTRGLMPPGPTQFPAQRRTSTSSLGHAPAFGTAFSRSISVQDLTSATTAGLLLPVHPQAAASSGQASWASSGVTSAVGATAGAEHVATGSLSPPGGTAGGASGGNASLVGSTYAPLRPSPLIQSHTLTAVSDSPPTRSSNSSSGDSILPQRAPSGTPSAARTNEILAQYGHSSGALQLGHPARARGGAHGLGSGSSLTDTGGHESFDSFTGVHLGIGRDYVDVSDMVDRSARSDAAEYQAGRTVPNLYRNEAEAAEGGRRDASSEDQRAWRTSALVDSDDSDDEQMADISSSSLSDARSFRVGRAGGHASGTSGAQTHTGRLARTASPSNSSPSSSTPSSPIRLGRARLRTKPLPPVGRGPEPMGELDRDSDDADMLTAALNNIDTGLRVNPGPAGQLGPSLDLTEDAGVVQRAPANSPTEGVSLPPSDSRPFGWPAETGRTLPSHARDHRSTAVDSTLTTPSPSPSSTTTNSARSSIGDLSTTSALQQQQQGHRTATSALFSSAELMSASLELSDYRRNANKSHAIALSPSSDGAMEHTFGQVTLTSPPPSASPAVTSPAPSPSHSAASERPAMGVGIPAAAGPVPADSATTPRSNPVALPALSTGASLPQPGPPVHRTTTPVQVPLGIRF